MHALFMMSYGAIKFWDSFQEGFIWYLGYWKLYSIVGTREAAGMMVNKQIKETNNKEVK